MLDILDNDIYEINANGDPSTVTFGADNGLTLADLKGVTDLDDERWSLLMDQLTLEEGMIRLGLGGTSTKAIESIMSPETIQNDGPNGIYSYPLASMPTPTKPAATPALWMPTTPTSHTNSARWSTRPSLPRPSTRTSLTSTARSAATTACGAT